MMEIDIDKIYKILEEQVLNYKVPVVNLVKKQTQDPFKILVSTILSARTKDEITRVVSKRLFSKIKNYRDLSKLSVKQIEKLIYPIGFYKNKAKLLKQLPVVLKKEFNGKVPDNINALIKLPGVGRKTANLVVGVAFNKPSICVDTHVHRIMNHIGYIKTKTPFETEMALRKKLPKKYWIKINYLLVVFGQNVCKPVSPKCSICPIKKYCNKVNVETKYG